MEQKPKGTYDVLPTQSRSWQELERRFLLTCQEYGFKEIRIPIFEHKGVFFRDNDNSDMVIKQTYNFLDLGGREMTLRPEFTAGICRAFVENKLYANANENRLSYHGPNFRYERPQKGRFRQFSQLGIEFFGTNDIKSDLEVLSFAYNFFAKLQIKPTLEINTIGNQLDRDVYQKELVKYFTPHLNELCPDCQKRLTNNPLRILDCKVDNQLPFFQSVPKIKDSLSNLSLTRFQEVLKGLDQLQLPYTYNPFLVRGLDYYNDTVFEFCAQVDEKTRLALGGGGRYDQLVKEMGGPETAAIGFACGMERLLLVAQTDSVEKIDFYLISLSDQLIGLNLITILRSKGYHCLLSYQTSSLRNQMTNAFKTSPHYILILGEDEIKNEQVTLKDCLLNTQVTIARSKFLEQFSGGK